MNSVQFLQIKDLSLLLKNGTVFFKLLNVSLITKLEAVSRIYKALVSHLGVLNQPSRQHFTNDIQFLSKPC